MCGVLNVSDTNILTPLSCPKGNQGEISCPHVQSNVWAEQVNDARMFTRGNHMLENIPPSRAALFQYAKHAIYQAGHIWGYVLIACPSLPSASEWVWTKAAEHDWSPLWSDLPKAATVWNELVRCNCKKRCAGNCKCCSANQVHTFVPLFWTMHQKGYGVTFVVKNYVISRIPKDIAVL